MAIVLGSGVKVLTVPAYIPPSGKLTMINPPGIKAEGSNAI